MRAQYLLAALALALPASPARAQAPASAEPLTPLPLDGRHVAPYSRDFHIVMVRGGVEQPMGSARDRVEATTVEGRPALLRVQTTVINGGTQVDSAITLWDSIIPASLAMRKGQRSVHLAFAGPRAWGTLNDTSGARPMERSGEGVLYNTSMLEFVIGSLPLREGYAASFDVIDSFRDGMPVFRVALTVRGTMQMEEADGRKADAWVIDATMGGQAARFYFDVATRQWMGVVLFAAPGTEIRYVPA